MKKLITILLITVSIVSCEDKNEQHEKDIELIKSYLKENNITAESTNSGLHYTINTEGNGKNPTIDSWVKVSYRGKLLDESIFDEGITESYLTGYIQGWIEGLQYFSEGGSGTLFIPSRLGYGEMSKSSIPSNSVLIFDIELLAVEN